MRLRDTKSSTVSEGNAFSSPSSCSSIASEVKRTGCAALLPEGSEVLECVEVDVGEPTTPVIWAMTWIS